MPLTFSCKEPHPLKPGIYRTDIFNRNPLFSISDSSKSKKLLVSSWEEAYALHGPANVKDINLKYLANLINRTPDPNTSPYTKITRLPRSSHILLNNSGNIKSFFYDPFFQGISKNSKKNVHEYIFNFIENTLVKSIKKSSLPNICCEHSSGIDSNALLGMLVHKLKIPINKIHTWSIDHTIEGKLLKEFRVFHNLNIQNCHLTRDRTINNQNDEYQKSLKTIEESLDIFGCPAPMLGWNIEMAKVIKSKNCGIIFSGFGGDQGLSHHGMNRVPELIKGFRINDLINFYHDHPAPLKSFLENIIFFLNPEFIRNRKLNKLKKNYPQNTLKKHLSVKGLTLLNDYFYDEYLWDRDMNVDLDCAIRNSISSNWVTVRSESEQRILNYFGIEKVFPFLDESLISTLINQDSAYFASSYKKGRLLARETFSDVLPPFLRTNPEKGRPQNYEWIERYNKYKFFEIEMKLKEISFFEKDLKSFFNIDDLIRDVEKALTSQDHDLSLIYDISTSLNCLYTLNFWWERLT